MTGQQRFIAYGLIAFVLLMTFDGAIRKWGLPGAQQVIFILKDVLLLGLLGYALTSGVKRLAPSAMPAHVQVAMAAYFGWVVVQGFNPHLPNFAVALLGMKAHLLYAALIVLMPIATRSLADVGRILAVFYPILVLPPLVIGIAQVFSPADSILNRQIGEDLEAIAYFGEAGLVRVTGTFSYISGMAAFLCVAALVGVWLVLSGVRSLLVIILVALTIGTLPMSGSRAVLTIVVAGAGLMLAAALAAGVLSLGRATMMAAVAGLAVILSGLYFDSIWQALWQRFSDNADEGQTRVVTAFGNAFDYFEVAGPLGFGTGAANLGAPALVPGVTPFSWLPVGTQFEEEAGRIVLELGSIGWGLSMLLRIAILAWVLQLVVSGRSRAIRLVGILALPFAALALYQGQGVFAATYQAVAFWFVVAVVAMAEAEQRRLAGSARPAREQREAVRMAVRRGRS
ncbi:MAG: hypothetical protein NW205_03160 [Hyphomicrobiaceae bacterium]|nr:hypothetical protein [Hyphomicrobiaceae bacterium]